jgi:hypothetical protein
MTKRSGDLLLLSDRAQVNHPTTMLWHWKKATRVKKPSHPRHGRPKLLDLAPVLHTETSPSR